MSRLFFVSDRTDGLGERLRSIVNAIYLANKFGGIFVLDWKVKTGTQASFHSITNACDLFSEDFIEQHLIKGHIQQLESARELAMDNFADVIETSGPENIYKVFVPQSAIYRYLPLLKKEIIGGGFRDSFESILFSRDVSRAMDNAKLVGIPNGSIAVHLRAGDVIYGNFRHNARFCNKAIPYQQAESLLKSLVSEGHSVILFGQDERLISYLTEKYHAVAASSLLVDNSLSVTQIALSEIVLMSRCKHIISGNSGFAVLASAIAGETRTPIDWSTESPRANLVLETLCNDPHENISIEQQVFSFRWAIGMHTSTLELSQIEDLCLAGLKIAMNDPFFSVVLASCHAANGKIQESKSILESILSCNSPSFISRLLDPSAFGSKATASFVLDTINPILRDNFSGYISTKG